MVFSTEFLNLVKNSSTSFQDRKAWALFGCKTSICSRILWIAPSAQRFSETKDLAYEILKLADVQITRSFLDSDAAAAPLVPRTYRGQPFSRTQRTANPGASD